MVTSVPSDSPDDYAALRDLKNKKVVASLALSTAELPCQALKLTHTPAVTDIVQDR